MAVRIQQHTWGCRQKPKGVEDSEKQQSFPRRNWIIVILLKSLTAIAYTITIPSMHQFVTNPDTTTLPSAYQIHLLPVDDEVINEAPENAWTPGLGQSESFYTWSVTGYSLGELTGAIGAGLLTKFLPYRVSFLLGIALCPLGYLLYSLATGAHAWMVLIARLCIGINAGFLLVLITSYLGETATEVSKSSPRSHKDNSSLKDRLFLCYSFITTLSYPIAPGINSVVAQFPDVNPYRWGAVFLIVLSSVYIGAFLVVFKEHKTFRCGTDLQLHSENSSKPNIRQVVVFTVLILCQYSSGSCYSVLDTLLNPVLSDHFGFTITDSSYFVLGGVTAFAAASFLLLILKQLQLNNRKVYMLAVLMALSGTAAMSDWQSIGNDPCLVPSTTINNTAVATLELQGNITTSRPLSMNQSLESLANSCEELNSTLQQCYWNPNSRITGKLCQDCYPVCRSIHKSLNFIQFTAGFIIFSASMPLQSVPLLVVISDFSPPQSQGAVMGIFFATSSLARVVSPLWSDRLYELSGKHTYLPLAVMIITSVVTLLGFITSYKGIHSSVSRHMTVELELDRLDADSSKSADSDAEEMSERGIDEDGGEMECSPLMNRQEIDQAELKAGSSGNKDSTEDVIEGEDADPVPQYQATAISPLLNGGIEDDCP